MENHDHVQAKSLKHRVWNTRTYRRQFAQRVPEALPSVESSDLIDDSGSNSTSSYELADF